MYVMIIHGYARDDIVFDSPGSYLEWYDPNIPDDTKPMMQFTYDIKKAKRFERAVEAMHEWNRIRDVDPIRPDGKPNKPLTAFTIEVVSLGAEA